MECEINRNLKKSHKAVIAPSQKLALKANYDESNASHETCVQLDKLQTNISRLSVSCLFGDTVAMLFLL